MNLACSNNKKKKKKKKPNVEGTKKNGMIISYDYFINND
jgi:hypothetical protein